MMTHRDVSNWQHSRLAGARRPSCSGVTEECVLYPFGYTNISASKRSKAYAPKIRDLTRDYSRSIPVPFVFYISGGFKGGGGGGGCPPPPIGSYFKAAFSCKSYRIYTGWPKKESHYRESALNRIKIVNQARFFTNFDYKMSTRILYVRI